MVIWMSSQSSTRKIAEKIAVINDRSVFLGFDVYMTLELLCKTATAVVECRCRAAGRLACGNI